jgi:hypothetical protein
MAEAQDKDVHLEGLEEDKNAGQEPDEAGLEPQSCLPMG